MSDGWDEIGTDAELVEEVLLEAAFLIVGKGFALFTARIKIGKGKERRTKMKGTLNKLVMAGQRTSRGRKDHWLQQVVVSNIS